MSSPSTLWTFKDPYKVNIPTDLKQTSKPERDLWTILCEEQLQEDKERCEGWKDEIQNLLVFAGLFSAVVTTFVVDSYKNIQPDPQGMTVVLLAQLVSQLAPNGHNNSVSTEPIPPFTPDRSEVRVNVYWFLSLVVSLGTASAGITTLQWIREFQQYDPDLTSKQAFALRNLRAESFDNWQVPTIIATLPFLIQVALVLFLVGLSDFLFNSVSPTVATPSAVISGIIISFLLISIILPTLQHLALLSGLFKKDIPTPCPYRSPPGWGYFRFAYWVTTHVLPISRAIGATFLFITDLLSRPSTTEQPGKGFVQACKDLARKRFRGGVLTKRPNAISYTLPWGTELEWLLKRDDVSQPPKPPGHEINIDFDDRPHDLLPVEYDAARGLASMVDRSFRGRSTPYALYNCFRDLPSRVKGKTFFSRMSDQGAQPKTGVEVLYDEASDLVVQAEKLMFFLDSFEQTRTTSLRHGFADHQLELCVRVLGGIFNISHTSPRVKDSIARQRTSLESYPSDLWLPRILTETNGMRRLSSLQFGDTIREQLLLVFERFITSSRARQPLAAINVYHTFQQIVPLTELIARVIRDTLRPGSTPTDEADPNQPARPLDDEQLTGDRRRRRHTMIETIGTNINRLLTEFLQTDFTAYSPQNALTHVKECPDRFEKTALYLTSTVYLTNVLSNLKNDIKFHNLTKLQDEMKYIAPMFVSSFIDFMKAWYKRSTDLGPELENMRIFGDIRFFVAKKRQVELLCNIGLGTGLGREANRSGGGPPPHGRLARMRTAPAAWFGAGSKSAGSRDRDDGMDEPFDGLRRRERPDSVIETNRDLEKNDPPDEVSIYLDPVET